MKDKHSVRANRAEPALAVARGVLARDGMAGFELYSFRAAPINDRLYMRIDKVGPRVEVH